MSFNTPLRYPGGKGRLTRYVGQVLELNDLLDGDYVEPYAGGAGIAITLLYLEYVRRIHVNDINPSVHAFWKAVLTEPEALCRLIRDTKVTIKEWHRQRAIQKKAGNVSTLELAFSTFFLNRTNRSGIIQGGVIGGKNQDGPWKLDARYNKLDLTSRILKIASYKSRIMLTNMDAVAYIQEQLPQITCRALVYLDPPYYTKGRGLYTDFYNHEDHQSVAKAVGTSIKQKWIVSYDNSSHIKDMYAAFRQDTFALHYSANKRFSGTELMVFCPGLKLPPDITPSRAAA